MERKMKPFIVTAAILLATQAHANDRVSATIEDFYVTENVSNPVHVNECYNVDVPVYGTRDRRGSDGDVIVGALIGGAIGNQFGSGSGQDAMTVLGAIVGANRAANQTSEEIVGYRTERQCTESVVYENQRVRRYSYSTITFTVDGKRQVVRFEK
jgi:uncharacterized protein YcfJ